MTGIEPYIPKISAFLFGLSQKCIVAVVKKWKESKDQAKTEETKAVLDELEFAKRIATKVQQRITASIRDFL